ncbi:unnamed protein product [Dovyalis caffra]|uniref:Uncharacterized protein n=1 Tax=Dovyalis caffra TaxID=77055 RepID=A0AAV1SHS0_9ROSI|nr:unnamed protein product [Dovyalis caffra]
MSHIPKVGYMDRQAKRRPRQREGGRSKLAVVMGRVFLVELDAAGGDCYRCKFCDTPLALADHLLSTPLDHDSEPMKMRLCYVPLSNRWRISAEITEEFNLDARPRSSDGENPEDFAAYLRNE